MERRDFFRRALGALAACVGAALVPRQARVQDPLLLTGGPFTVDEVRSWGGPEAVMGETAHWPERQVR